MGLESLLGLLSPSLSIWFLPLSRVLSTPFPAHHTWQLFFAFHSTPSHRHRRPPRAFHDGVSVSPIVHLALSSLPCRCRGNIHHDASCGPAHLPKPVLTRKYQRVRHLHGQTHGLCFSLGQPLLLCDGQSVCFQGVHVYPQLRLKLVRSWRSGRGLYDYARVLCLLLYRGRVHAARRRRLAGCSSDYLGTI